MATQAQEFSDKELKVLKHFNMYLMTPGNMLCLSAQEIEGMQPGLENLVEREMLLPEGSRGAYCLTQAGFKAMKSAFKK